MHHTAAFTLLLGTTVNTDVPALTDDVLGLANNHFLPQRDYKLLASFNGAPTLNRVRLASPSNRIITQPFLRPVTAAILPPTDPNVADYRDNPFLIRSGEEWAIEATSDIAMGTERFTSVNFLETLRKSAPIGDIQTIRGTSVTAAVANVWTTVTVTWADTLPAGEYDICGLEYVAVNGIAARLNLEDVKERPGCLGMATIGLRSHEMFRKGGLGSWGKFTSTRMPIVQVLNNGVDAVHTFYMDFVRTR